MSPKSVREFEEPLRVEEATLSRGQRLRALAGDLAALRDRWPAPAPTPSLDPKASTAAGVLVGDPLDTAFALTDERFAHVTHVFHQEWHGIRAAAGYLPGRKVAIAADRVLTRAEMSGAVAACTSGGARTVVLHAFSENAEALVRFLRQHAGSSLRIVSVWHGSTAQFHSHVELDGFARLLRLRGQGVLDAIACVKPDMHLLSDRIDRRTVLNIPPRIPSPFTPRPGPRSVAMIPVPNDWRKNFYTNLYAASRCMRIRDVYVTTGFPHPTDVFALRCRVTHVERPSRRTMFRLIADSDVILNATLSECQPMTALEGLALGVPCLTGPLSLGELDAHPYQKLCQVVGVDSVGQLSAAIDRMLDVPPFELRALMQDYHAQLCSAATERFFDLVQP